MPTKTATRTALLALAIAASSTAVSATPAAAETTCAKWAATAGDDGAAGTAAAPYRSLAKLVASLQAGETGCLPAGQVYEAVAGNGIARGGAGTAASPLTITSGPGGRAVIAGMVLFDPASHDVVLTGIDFQGIHTSQPDKATHFKVEGDRITIVDNDISNPRGICIGAGRITATENHVAEDLLIAENRIHGCGMDPGLAWYPADSGSHGVYLENTLRARVVDNLIYGNRWRGLQLYPRNDGALIERNLFDENATHINIGSSLTDNPPGPYMAQNTTVQDNVFSGRVTDFWPDDNPAQVFGNFPAGSPTYGNLVAGNCFAPGDTAAYGSGFEFRDNVVEQALFTDRAARDYRLTGSACVGYGPESIQPAPDDVDHAVTVAAKASAATGDTLPAGITVLNRSATARTLTVDLTASAGFKLLGIKASAGSCTGTTCTASVPAGGSVKFTATLGVVAGGSQSLTAAIRETDATPGDNQATDTVTITGPTCTAAGTQAGETVQGTAGDDVLCLFGGNDTALPGPGTDIVVGGVGTDRLSYSTAGNAVTVNLTQGGAWDSSAGTAVGWDTFREIEGAIGSGFGDTLVGSPARDILDGRGGVDEAYGYAGNDSLKGGGGNDKLYGGDDNDAFNGGSGVDICDQGPGTGTKTACEA